jgi:hypothetical protein
VIGSPTIRSRRPRATISTSGNSGMRPASL